MHRQRPFAHRRIPHALVTRTTHGSVAQQRRPPLSTLALARAASLHQLATAAPCTGLAVTHRAALSLCSSASDRQRCLTWCTAVAMQAIAGRAPCDEWRAASGVVSGAAATAAGATSGVVCGAATAVAAWCAARR